MPDPLISQEFFNSELSSEEILDRTARFFSEDRVEVEKTGIRAYVGSRLKYRLLGSANADAPVIVVVTIESTTTQTTKIRLDFESNGGPAVIRTDSATAAYRDRFADLAEELRKILS